MKERIKKENNVIKKICFLLLMIAPLLQPYITEAHSGSHGYSEVIMKENKVTYDLYVLADLLGGLLNIDLNQDGYMQENEIAKSKYKIEQYVVQNLSVINNGLEGTEIVKRIALTHKSNYEMFHIELEYEFEQPIEEYEINYYLFYNGTDNNHQNFMTIKIEDQKFEHIITKSNFVIQGKVDSNNDQLQNDRDINEIPSENSGTHSQIESKDYSWNSQKKEDAENSKDIILGFWDYATMGMKHIWTGLDHILFLFGLLIVRSTLGEYVKILTAFTVGHSITLALAALEVVIIPSSVIEPLIALSIVYVAIENIVGKTIKWRWLMTLFFGLIHGFGFAEILTGWLEHDLIFPLFSFNLGLELGQIFVLIFIIPINVMFSKFHTNSRIVYSVSTLICLIGLFWFFDRII